MPFTIRGVNGTTDAMAQQKVSFAFSYLRRSELARTILDDLAERADVCIDVDTTKDPFYAHPESSYDTITSGGTVVWNPDVTLPTKDSKNFRPNARWVTRAKVVVQKQGLSKKFARTLGLRPTKKVRRGTDVHRFGTLSPPMCLMHELGHALQYATYPEEFRAIKGDPSLQKVHVHNALEETNLCCVEIPVAMELNDKGANETPRWVYDHAM